MREVEHHSLSTAKPRSKIRTVDRYSYLLPISETHCYSKRAESNESFFREPTGGGDGWSRTRSCDGFAVGEYIESGRAIDDYTPRVIAILLQAVFGDHDVITLNRKIMRHNAQLICEGII